MPFFPSLKHPNRRWGVLSVAALLPIGAIALIPPLETARAQTKASGRAITVRSDVQEANQQTGVVTATGNVQINYPARQMTATSAQAQYFSRENRIILTGNVYVLQQGGNSIRAETVTYLIDEGRFIAVPQPQRQVESTYIVSDPEAPAEPPVAPAAPPFNPKPAFKTPVSE